MDIATIQRRIGMIQKLQEEIKIAKGALKQVLEDDSAYKTVAEEAKQAASKKKQIKDQIWGSQANRALLEDIKVNTEEITTLQDILNQELVDYYHANGGKQEIEDESGNPIKFKVIVKLFPQGFTEQP